jgi:hypothetical protein
MVRVALLLPKKYGIGRLGSIRAAGLLPIVRGLQGDKSCDQRPGNAYLGLHLNRIGISTGVGGSDGFMKPSKHIQNYGALAISRNDTLQHR